MQYATKYFGTIDFDEDDVLSFPNGLFGFEEEKRFLLLPFHGSDGNLLCFQSAATPSLAFVAMNPFSLMPGYAPALSEEELRLMEAGSIGELCCYVLCAVREPVAESTVNLRCPIVVNPARRLATQVILGDAAYPMRRRLGDFSRKEAERVC